MVLRLLMTGLCAACVVLLATFQPLRIEVLRAPPGHHAEARHRVDTRDRSAQISVVDVASTVAPADLVSLLRLRDNERVSAVNDRSLDDDIEPSAMLDLLAPHAGEYIDLTVSSTTTERRVLVLMH